MTSPKQRKKRLAILIAKETRLEIESTVEQKQVEVVVEPVVESQPVVKPKKSKTGLVELKSQEQVVEQNKEEVKITSKE